MNKCRNCRCEFDPDFNEGYKRYFCTQHCHGQYYNRHHNSDFQYKQTESNCKMCDEERLAILQYSGYDTDDYIKQGVESWSKN
jgi:hypothetical protein